MTVLSMLQDPIGKGGTATAVSFYRAWMDSHMPDRQELYLDEQDRGGIARLIKWRGDTPEIPRFLPELQVPPYLAARLAVKKQRFVPSEVHVVGASSMHGSVVAGAAPTLVW